MRFACSCFLPLPSINIALGHCVEDKPEAQSTWLSRDGSEIRYTLFWECISRYVPPQCPVSAKLLLLLFLVVLRIWTQIHAPCASGFTLLNMDIICLSTARRERVVFVGNILSPVSHIDNFSMTRQERIANTLLTALLQHESKSREPLSPPEISPQSVCRLVQKTLCAPGTKGDKMQSRVHTTL